MSERLINVPCGVIGVRAVGKVSKEDYERAHGELSGLVIHAQAFPGWKNLHGHIHFICDGHRSVGRIALALDTKLASPLDAAIAWAAER